MKKILSVFLALALLCSVFALNGCEKSTESMTDRELFSEALHQISTPKMFEKLTESELFKNANHATFSIDKLDADFEDLIGVDLPTLPSIGFDIFRYDDDDFALEGNVELDGDSLGAKLEIKDGERFFFSMPDASDLYFTASLNELLDEYDDSVFADTDKLKDMYSSLSEAFGKLEDVILDGNLERSSDESEEVFGEEISLDRLTLTLDEKTLKDMFSTVIDALPEELLEELFGTSTVDEMLEDSEFSLDAELAFFFDGNALRLCTLSVIGEEGTEQFKIKGRIELENSEKKFDRTSEFSLSANGTELITLDSECSFELDGKELTGEMSFKPTVTDAAAGDLSGTVQSLELSADIDGTFSREDFDIDAELELSVEGIALKLPVAFNGSYDDEHIELESTLDFNLIGTSFKIESSASLEKLDDLKSGSYSDENAITVEDAITVGDENGNIEKFTDDVADYLSKNKHIYDFIEEIAEIVADIQYNSNYGFDDYDDFEFDDFDYDDSDDDYFFDDLDDLDNFDNDYFFDDLDDFDFGYDYNEYVA